jgi:hypothetical protein
LVFLLTKEISILYITSHFFPIAGFSNVHKAIVAGEQLGAIVGTSFLKDANNNLIIDDEGYPLVNTTPVVIGRPLADFTMKMNNSVEWKMLQLAIDWEWRKGGDIWNGTAAALDYYGRSENSAAQRNITNHVFRGVTKNGHPNTMPVNFYDPSLPFEKNRWVRYGLSGVAEEYIHKADNLRINHVGLTYKKELKKYLRSIALTAYASNIILWTAYKGADPNRLLFDQSASTGLDFFNLPSTKTFGFTTSIQF